MNDLLIGIIIGAFIICQVWLHLSVRAHKKRFKKFQDEMKGRESGTKKAWKSFIESR